VVRRLLGVHRYTPLVPFPCPACATTVNRDGVRWLQRCPACGAWIRGRAVDTSGPAPAFEVEALGRPETRHRVSLPWDERARRRLDAWLLVASVATLALVVLLFVLARFL